MAVVQTFNHSENTVIKLLPSSGSSIIQVFEANPIRITQRLGLTAQYTAVNSFIKGMDLYTSITSIEEVDMPDFTLADSATDKARKAIDLNWNSPRKELTIWDSVNGGAWNRVAIVALHNPAGYPYRIYHLKDELTDSLYFEAGTGYRLGVSVQDVGFGGLTESDEVILRITGTSEVVVINPSTEVFKDILVNKYNQVTDENIGPRYVDDKLDIGTLPTAPITMILGSLACKIKKITGNDSWREDSIESIQGLMEAINELSNAVATLTQDAVLESELNSRLNTQWQDLPLASNWVNCVEFGTFPPQFRVLKDGTVELRGAIKALETPAYHALIATLPIQARPQAAVYIQAASGGSTNSQIDIYPSGEMRFQMGNATVGILMSGRFSMAF